MQKRFITGYFHLKLGFKDFVKTAIISDWLTILIWLFVFFGGIVLFFYKRKSENKIILVLAVWWVCIFFVGVLVPIIDHEIASALHRIPLELDLIRSLRYTIPLILLSAYLLSEFKIIIENNVNQKHLVNLAFIFLGLILLVGWIHGITSLIFNLYLNPCAVGHQDD